MAPHNVEDSSKRLHIISANEVAVIYDLPKFTAEDQAHFFSLSAHERAVLPQLHTYTSRIFFILQLGYFKAVRQFFVFKLGEVVQDVTWIQQTHFHLDTNKSLSAIILVSDFSDPNLALALRY